MLTALLAAAAAAVTVVGAVPPVTDVTTASGLAGTVNDNYANICQGDLNGDGRPDLVLSRHLLAPSEVFFKKADGSFRLAQQLDNRDPHGCAIFRDDLGRTHLLFAEGAEQGRLSDKSNSDWLVDATGHATEQQGFLGVTDPAGRGRVVLPVSLDGRPGLYVGNAPPESGGASVNHLYASVQGRLVEQDGPFSGTQNTFGAARTDEDGDGTDDILTFLGVGTRLWHRTADGSWVDQAATWHIAAAQAGAFGDVNGDGHDDLVTVSNSSLVVYLWTGNQFTRSWSRPLQAGRAVVIDDLDEDGHADLYAVTGDRTYNSNVNEPDVLLFGTGSGTSWRDASAALPQVTTGGGGAATVLHGTRAVRVLVTNGADGDRHQAGPRQVLRITPAAP